MTLAGFINFYFLLAIILCAVGLLDKFFQLALLKRQKHSQAAVKMIDAPLARSFRDIAGKFFFGPATHFHRKANNIWTYGYAFYHIAIILVVTGYTASAIIMLGKIAAGVPIPDFYRHIPTGTSNSISNILAFIFGNAETFASRFLFGSFAPYFQAIAWIDLPLAVIGNGCLLYTVLDRRVGTISDDIDEACRKIRIKGAFSGQHLAVRLTILSIIIMEFIGRFGLIKDIAYYHAILGLSLIAVFPFTYLVHIPLMPVVTWLAFYRRRRNAIA